MRKYPVIIALVIAALAILNTIGCRERVASLPGPEPTATPIPTAGPTPVGTLIDDFGSVLDGKWISYGDSSDTGSFASATPGYDSTGYALALKVTSVCGGGDWGYWLCVELAGGSATDISSAQGIRFHIKEPLTNQLDLVLLSSATSNNYKYTFSPTSGWGEMNVPFSSFTQDTSDGTTISQALAQSQRVCWAVMACPAMIDAWLDHVVIY